jgi:hypothetical protein
LIPAIYEECSKFSESLAGVKAAGKWGYIDKMGDVVIGLQFDSVSMFSNGLAKVQVSKK